MPVKAIFLFVSIFFILTNICISQNQNTAGGYLMEHYGVRTYGMHPRNFYITQDSRGIMYFANAYGVLEYDGKYWNNIPLPNGNSGLSLALDTSSNVFVGSYNELGFLYADTISKKKYQSSFQEISTTQNNIGGIEHIIPYENQMLYCSLNGIYTLKDDKYKTVYPSNKNNVFQFVNKINHVVYVQESDRGLHQLINGKLQLIKNGVLFKNTTIKDIISLSDQTLLVIEKNGIFVFDYNTLKPWNSNSNAILKQQELTHGLVLKNGNYVITTKSNGLYILSPSGEIIETISEKNGLPNNSINYAYTDKQGGLWLALDNGIARIEINSPFSFIGKTNGLFGMGYTAAVFENKLYVGTSEGLFYSPLNNSEYVFKPVIGLRGYVWDLSIINNTLLCCQNEGVFQIKNSKAIAIKSNYDLQGNWKFISLKQNSSLALKGTYEGFQLYELQNGTWKFKNKINGFSESCRVFVEDDDKNIWMCHGNKGIYKISLSPDLKNVRSAINYSLEKGYAPDFFNDVRRINNKLVFSTDNGTYVLDKNNNFIKNSSLDKTIGENRYVNRLIQSNNNLWVFSGNDVFLYSPEYSFNQSSLKKITGNLVGSFEFAMSLNKDISVIGTQEGIALYNTTKARNTSTKFKSLIRKIEAPFQNDSLLFGGATFQISSLKNSTSWNYSLNTLRISYTSPYYDEPEKIRYQYSLIKEDEKKVRWSGWTNNTQVEFSNLWEGDYTFKVRAKNIYDEISEEGIYYFTICPPWYRSNLSYWFYALTCCIGSFFLYKAIKARFKIQKEKLQAEQKQELLLQEQKHLAEKLQAEKELIGLRNEKLEAEVVLKNNELANLATSLTQKTEFLSHLKDKLETIHKDSDQMESPIFKEVIKTIDQDLDFDDNWSNFQIHFDQLHHNFLHRLREQFPKLNPSWLLLCAYIRMNKSNKEIAGHMNLSLGGVEKRKYRLREKLELDSDAKLSDFIANF